MDGLTAPQQVFQLTDAVDELMSVGCPDFVAQYSFDPAPQGVSLSSGLFQFVTGQGEVRS